MMMMNPAPRPPNTRRS